MFIANKVGISLEGEYLETTSLKGTDANPEERSASTWEKYVSIFPEARLEVVDDAG